jgi:hypothetical protein
MHHTALLFVFLHPYNDLVLGVNIDFVAAVVAADLKAHFTSNNTTLLAKVFQG